MDMMVSKLLLPLVIFTGVFGARFMKKWQTYNHSLVLFTKKYWMTTETFVIYLDWLMDFYKGKKIGLIIDYALSHDNLDLAEWVQKLNDRKRGTQTVLIIDWID